MINVETKHLASTDPSLPSLALQVIELVESYMIWVGIARGGSLQDAVLAGSLGKDWACAMPPNVCMHPCKEISRRHRTHLKI